MQRSLCFAHPVNRKHRPNNTLLHERHDTKNTPKLPKVPPARFKATLPVKETRSMYRKGENAPVAPIQLIIYNYKLLCNRERERERELGSFENSYIPENPRTPPISYIFQTTSIKKFQNHMYMSVRLTRFLKFGKTKVVHGSITSSGLLLHIQLNEIGKRDLVVGTARYA
ncbi:hypothetical protein LXL04_027934 [Taraxacum kok-saghyz]